MCEMELEWIRNGVKVDALHLEAQESQGDGLDQVFQVLGLEDEFHLR